MESSTRKEGKPDLKEIKKIAKQMNDPELLADTKKRMTHDKNIEKWEK